MDNAPNAGEVLFGLIGVVVGFLSSFAIFRARFTAIEKDVENLKSDFKRELAYLREEAKKEWARIRDDVNRACSGLSVLDKDHQRRQERREIATLEMLGDIAKALRVSNRFTDVQSYGDTGDDKP